MAKTKSVYICSNCGSNYAKMMGKCFSCGEYNTIQEETVKKSKNTMINLNEIEGVVTPILNIEAYELQRLKAPGTELNRVLGGGIVPGSVILLGGEPGIGKSTLLLQTALRMNKKVLYVSGEESLTQIKMRADRIGVTNENCLLLNETCVEKITHKLNEIKPSFVIIDSIQTIYSKYLDSTPGTVSQVRESCALLVQYAKQNETPIILVGHITKEGQLAGPKLLEHMVDTVLQFEGETQNNYRILRTLKNRFGNSLELGIYEMTSEGMREVDNPSEILINQRSENLSGVSVVASLEGNRSLLIETQALVSSAVYGNPQRNTNGYDIKRLNMLLAVLEKRCGYKLSQQDIFVNIAGGLKINDPATDLGIAASIISSFENAALSNKMVFAGEIGLSGEIRGVNRIDQRIKEAEKLGFSDFILSDQIDIRQNDYSIKIHKIADVRQFFSLVIN
ncbi:DNA repair protein RadA [Bacteroidia bacterium]|jgi:DNA repair protein RadA/Sms|nr:DNA repair protein RadA [Bacteroidia bacterium]MDC0561143.1 DNA repair protein RadA [Bacteroidia bacterium]MDC3406146.1 DNA repair protein RadA [Bacteroidia bacterium]CAI8184757.1 MAG: DNA repair protein RadA [Bacteroidia bacterium]